MRVDNVADVQSIGTHHHGPTGWGQVKEQKPIPNENKSGPWPQNLRDLWRVIFRSLGHFFRLGRKLSQRNLDPGPPSSRIKTTVGQLSRKKLGT